ncbi:hypothetical protein AB0V79_15080 [Mesorhizobium ciceri]|uniref:hypothetical protein n=1 Tax=Mesorhizobium TaxID=68287 RepID=UPI0007A93CE6|nr:MULTISPECIES: hypothetical protein [Mesorhizobium]AMY02417.1 hypothetical protein A4R29_25075 [Mesorhizobium ciceri biovar biserrulae]MDF3155369.1 hypothetical protein [Mesorhizobium sp. XAP10]MDF3248250.1 hypothetical protein [Mesorhizobium sp. XAP4]RVA46267.1 hypothetical protein EN933_21540 [Mesorhizobium sp. M7A.F.Ca.US.001.01.1.1]
MNLVPDATMAATIVGMTAIAVIPGVITIPDAQGLTLRAFFGAGQNHAPKEEENDAGEHHQQNSEMHPSGRVHLNSPLYPRPGRQFDNTMWM